MAPESTDVAVQVHPAETGVEHLLESHARLLEQVKGLEQRLRRGEERRWALLHIMGDMNELNKRLGEQRKAMMHILVDYEHDRRRVVRQAERLDNSRRALLHILQDVHHSNERLSDGRKAMIHIMGDLRETTEEVQRREQELRDKQEQLVQAGKLATVGELTTGIAHELNNPLNNIGLFVGNAIDHIELGVGDRERLLDELRHAVQEVRRATAIISHLRTFGRVAPVSREPVRINGVVRRSFSLLYEQLRMRQIEVRLDLCPEDPVVVGNAIQLEQVFINLLTNARDALADAPRKLIHIESAVSEDVVDLLVRDTGPGIPEGLQQRIFDPFFTTKEVGAGTGLGLSISYGIVKEHGGSISVVNGAGDGATFLVQLPLPAHPAEPAR
ncbi:MAG: two-component sensor histidine kinase [Candidatus Rokuibacteriota bacterium]|nr:MAG: two-component sensor histidine kinase [Candidatus Rokubacteria bacterium]